MERFVHGQNLIRFSQQLAAERDPDTQATLMRLLVDEENSLGAGLEHLEIVERCIASARQLIETRRELVALLTHDGQDTRDGDRLLETLLRMQNLFETYRKRIIDHLEHRR
jgi:hypothetical protein